MDSQPQRQGHSQQRAKEIITKDFAEQLLLRMAPLDGPNIPPAKLLLYSENPSLDLEDANP